MSQISESISAVSKLLFVLDFDGVILNSLYEKLVVGFNAHLRVNGESTLLGGAPLDFHDYQVRLDAEPGIYEAFQAYVPLIGDVGENCAAFRLIEAGERIADRDSFTLRISQFGDNYLRTCSTEVLDLRRKYAEMSAYADLCPAFDTIVRDIVELAGSIDFAVCTTKPLENVQHFSKEFAIDRFITRTHVCQDNIQKVDILQEIARERAVKTDEIGFIDDFARHLVPANAAGFYCLFADWGFGGPADRKEVLRAGIASVSLNEFAGTIREFVKGHAARECVS